MRPDTEVEDDASIMRIVLKAYRFDKTMIDVNGLYLHLLSRLCLQEKKRLAERTSSTSLCFYGPKPSSLAVTGLRLQPQKQRSNTTLHSLQFVRISSSPSESVYYFLSLAINSLLSSKSFRDLSTYPIRKYWS